MPTGSTYGGRRRKYKRTQKLKHKRRKTMRKRLVRLRGGGKDSRLIDAVLTNNTDIVLSVLADLIIETKAIALDELVNNEKYRSTSGKLPLEFTIRHKTSGILGFGGSSDCLPKKEFNRQIYYLLRLLGASEFTRTKQPPWGLRLEQIMDISLLGEYGKDNCWAYENDVHAANVELEKAFDNYRKQAGLIILEMKKSGKTWKEINKKIIDATKDMPIFNLIYRLIQTINAKDPSLRVVYLDELYAGIVIRFDFLEHYFKRGSPSLLYSFSNVVPLGKDMSIQPHWLGEGYPKGGGRGDRTQGAHGPPPHARAH
jgi:hypothetical protein